ncbi:MAG: hypothetical protein QXZ20_00590 [Candidatus Aenigmatarchaeota archaeon]
MAQLALEYIVRILILTVVAAIVILTIINFYDDIKVAISNWLFPKKDKVEFPKTITKDSFSSAEIANYIVSCHSTIISIPETEQKDMVCYVLLSRSGFSVSSTEILASIPADIKPNVEIRASFKKDYVKIEFRDINNKILVTE